MSHGPSLGSIKVEPECPSGAAAVHWPSSNVEREFSNERRKEPENKIVSVLKWFMLTSSLLLSSTSASRKSSVTGSGRFTSYTTASKQMLNRYTSVHTSISFIPLAEGLGEGEDIHLHRWQRYNHWRRAV